MEQNSIILKPPALKKGDLIAVIAPASHFEIPAFEAGVEKIRSWGFKVRYRPDIFAKKRYLAGEDQRRSEELCEALEDDAVKAIFFARGGYGSMRILPQLDKIKPPSAPKIILGYSDITSLLLYFYQRWGWVTFHGPVVAKDMSHRLHTSGEKSLLHNLCNPTPLGTLTPSGLISLTPGKAEGPLTGGCLSLLVCSLGTPYQLDAKDKILYLEDVGEILYSIDRMLTHLRLAGIFEGVRGIVFGPLKGAHDQSEVIQEMLKEVLGDLGVPILFGFPSGHQEDSWTIPLGLPVIVDGDHGSIIFPESATQP